MKLREYLRSLCFGAAVGGLALSLLFSKYPQIFPGWFSPEMAFGYGAAIGGALERLIGFVASALLKPLYDTVGMYLKLCQIVLLAHFLGPTNMPEAMKKELIDTLLKSHFTKDPERMLKPKEDGYELEE